MALSHPQGPLRAEGDGGGAGGRSREPSSSGPFGLLHIVRLHGAPVAVPHQSQRREGPRHREEGDGGMSGEERDQQESDAAYDEWCSR